jgi:hypothetical protein
MSYLLLAGAGMVLRQIFKKRDVYSKMGFLSLHILFRIISRPDLHDPHGHITLALLGPDPEPGAMKSTKKNKADFQQFKMLIFIVQGMFYFRTFYLCKVNLTFKKFFFSVTAVFDQDLDPN